MTFQVPVLFAENAVLEVFLTIVFIILGIMAWIRHSTAKENEEREYAQSLAVAKEQYIESLNRLKLSPLDPDLRTETLRLGRRYSDLTRMCQGVTVYDELAIRNDIDAVTGGR